MFKEAKKYCSEKQLEMQCHNEMISISGPEGVLSTNDENFMNKIKINLKSLYEMELINNILSSTWQGIIMKTRMEDEFIISGYYSWLTNWKSCPTNTISEIMLLISQTLSTKCFLKYRLNDDQMDTKCRLCHVGQESVKHLLSNCGEFVKKLYLDRHDSALKCFFFPMLVKFGFMSKSPFWFSAEKVKPCYENENYIVYWDIPEYRGTDDENEDSIPRPHVKIIMIAEKKIYLIEMTVPWIENREIKYEFKENKYKPIQTNLKLEHPGYEVDQITLVLDCLGGYSKHLLDNITKIFDDRTEVRNIVRDMQKSVISSAAHLSRVFKLRTLLV